MVKISILKGKDLNLWAKPPRIKRFRVASPFREFHRLILTTAVTYDILRADGLLAMFIFIKFPKTDLPKSNALDRGKRRCLNEPSGSR